MIDFLLGVPGKLKAISDYLTTNWTAGRAAKLDLLTVAPAPASTALTNATWTDARAAKIDLIGIKSIQRGVTTISGGVTSADATVTSVNMNKAMLHYLGGTSCGYKAYIAYAGAYVQLLNATTVRVFSPADVGLTTPRYVSWELVEYN